MPIKILFEELKEHIKKFPSVLLLIFVYIFIIPQVLSYDQSWVEPEQFYIKMGVVKTGEGLNFQDLKNGLSWQLFEIQPRSTRPLSSYFEILDTKFRVWLWHFMMPHPSLSLTWLFSLILTPIFLYCLLRNSSIGTDVAITMVAFYLATPGVLSCEAMLFRPAKPMTNFFIIFCLYLASRLKKKYIDQQKDIPWGGFIIFWSFTAFSFYWDETALLIFPSIFFFFPQVIRRKSFLWCWLSLPVVTYLGYFKIIPYLSVWAGQGLPQLTNYNKFAMMGHAHSFYQSMMFLGSNAKNLILETMGIIVPDVFKAPVLMAGCFYAAMISWGITLYYIFKVKQKWDLRLLFLVSIILFFNYLISITMFIWGPYYYGSFWSVFFVIYLAGLMENARIPRKVMIVCFFFILLNMANAFLVTNKIYKKYHYYPYNPWVITRYYWYDRSRFDPHVKPLLNGSQVKSLIYEYWSNVRQGKPIEQLPFPRELCWLPVELEPDKAHYWHNLLTPDDVFYLKGK